MQYLVRMAGEINIKSNQVRQKFHQRLRANIKAALNAAGIEHSGQGDWTRIFVEFERPSGLEALKRVFGLASISPIEYFCELDWEQIKTTILNYKDRVAGKTFRIRVKRSGVNLLGMTSIEMERELGSILYDYAAGVDLNNPDVEVEVELKDGGAHFFSERINGPGGLPLGVQGRSLCLISGGFDSPVAAWYMLKRGVELDFVYFELGSKQYSKNVLKVLDRLINYWCSGYQPRIHVVDFNEVAAEIKTLSKKNYGQVLLKRSMYRAAQQVAIETGLASLVLGESIGQVSSQTLPNLEVIDTATDLSIFRPVACFDKEEIIKMATKIGTSELSATIKENCSLVPKYPVTKGIRNIAEAVETEALFKKIDDAVSLREQIESVGDFAGCSVDVETVTELGDGDKLYDVRSKSEFDSWHIEGATHWDFDEMYRKCNSLDKGGQYLIYCTYGTMSSVVAEKLLNLGFNAKLYIDDNVPNKG